MRRALKILVAATSLLLLTVAAASPADRIVIRGADSGTHLRLAVSGSILLVTGPMEAVTQGCSFTRGHGAATCSLAGVGSIEIDAGPADDKVEVLDRLPAPLTAYLGAGSDKLVGNGEPDTCYAQGTARNRCIGEGGDDVCVAAPVNTDCVGGPGEDYCRTSDGSDGCWGGPGADTCSMGDGQDGCHGEAGDDRLQGGGGSDQLYGGEGFDYCDGGLGVGRSHDCDVGPQH